MHQSDHQIEPRAGFFRAAVFMILFIFFFSISRVFACPDEVTQLLNGSYLKRVMADFSLDLGVVRTRVSEKFILSEEGPGLKLNLRDAQGKLIYEAVPYFVKGRLFKTKLLSFGVSQDQRFLYSWSEGLKGANSGVLSKKLKIFEISRQQELASLTLARMEAAFFMPREPVVVYSDGVTSVIWNFETQKKLSLPGRVQQVSAAGRVLTLEKNEKEAQAFKFRVFDAEGVVLYQVSHSHAGGVALSDSGTWVDLFQFPDVNQLIQQEGLTEVGSVASYHGKRAILTSPDQAWVLSADTGKVLHGFRVEDKDELKKMAFDSRVNHWEVSPANPASKVVSVRWLNQDRWILILGRSARLYDVESGKLIAFMEPVTRSSEMKSIFTDAVLSEDFKKLTLISSEGVLQVYPLNL